MKKSIIIILAVVAVGAAAYFIYRKYYSVAETEEGNGEVDGDTDEEDDGVDGDTDEASGKSTAQITKKPAGIETTVNSNTAYYCDKYGFLYDKNGCLCTEEKYGEIFIRNTEGFIKGAHSTITAWQALYFDCGSIAEQLYDGCLDVNSKKSYKDLVDAAVEEIKSSLGDDVKLGTNTSAFKTSCCRTCRFTANRTSSGGSTAFRYSLVTSPRSASPFPLLWQRITEPTKANTLLKSSNPHSPCSSMQISMS